MPSGCHGLGTGPRREETQGVWRQGDIGGEEGADERKPKESDFRATWVWRVDLEIGSMPRVAPMAPEARGVSEILC